jgi:hypothetical protein
MNLALHVFSEKSWAFEEAFVAPFKCTEQSVDLLPFPWSNSRKPRYWRLIRNEQLLDGVLDLFGPALAIN